MATTGWGASRPACRRLARHSLNSLLKTRAPITVLTTTTVLQRRHTASKHLAVRSSQSEPSGSASQHCTGYWLTAHLVRDAALRSIPHYTRRIVRQVDDAVSSFLPRSPPGRKAVYKESRLRGSDPASGREPCTLLHRNGRRQLGRGCEIKGPFVPARLTRQVPGNGQCPCPKPASPRGFEECMST